MRVLITGGTGFIGSYILRALVKSGDHDIIALRRSTSSMNLIPDVKTGVEWVECDLFDIYKIDDLMKRCDAVIHVAGVVSMTPWRRDVVYNTNVNGTANLVDLAIDNNIDRFIHFSSVAAMGFMNDSEDETVTWTEPNSSSIYGWSKYLGEREAWRGFAEGLNMTIVNPSFVLGGSFWEFGPLQLLSEIDKGLNYYPVGSNGIVDVRDVAKMTLQLLGRSDLSGRQFICNGHNLSHLDLIIKLCTSMERSYPTTPIKGMIGALAWRWETFKSRILGSEAIFTKEAYEIASASLKYDNSQSRNVLDFVYLPIEKTINDMVSCYLQSRDENESFGLLPI